MLGRVKLSIFGGVSVGNKQCTSPSHEADGRAWSGTLGDRDGRVDLNE